MFMANNKNYDATENYLNSGINDHFSLMIEVVVAHFSGLFWELKEHQDAWDYVNLQVCKNILIQ